MILVLTTRRFRSKIARPGNKDDCFIGEYSIS